MSVRDRSKAHKPSDDGIENGNAPEQEAAIGGTIPVDTPAMQVIDTVVEAASKAAPEVFDEEDAPEGVYIEGETAAPSAPIQVLANAPLGSRFDDEHVGISGRFRINPETGIREPVYERYADSEGKSKVRRAS